MAIWVARLFLAGVLCAMSGCAAVPLPPPVPSSIGKVEAERTPPPVIVIRPEFAQATTTFALDLFRRVAAQDADKNVFISPANIAIALAMTANGARGETLGAMLAALAGDPSVALDTMNADYAALQASLQRSKPGITLTIANSLWARAGVSFYDDFLQRAERVYDAKIAALDFMQPSAPNIINAWVSDKTNGKINGIVDAPIPPETILILISAIYFNGKWQRPFDPSLTKDLPFNLLDGSQKSTPTMFSSDMFDYLKGDGFQAVRLPYTNDALRMVVFLPDKGRALTEFIATLTRENWEAWRAQFARKQGQVFLPRFRTQYRVTLNGVLQAMGMALAFDPQRADFSGMRPIPPIVYISKVEHLAYVDVSEAGTEAAAATAAYMAPASAVLDDEPFIMRVDRPFLFVIEDRNTGSLIFIGAIVEP